MTFTPGKSFENWMSVAGGGGGGFGNLNFAWVVWGISTGSVKSFQYNTRVSLEELQVKSLLIPVDDCVWWAKAKAKTLFYNQSIQCHSHKPAAFLVVPGDTSTDSLQDLESDGDNLADACLGSSGVDTGLSSTVTFAHISEELVPPSLMATLFNIDSQSFLACSVSQAKVKAPCLLHSTING